MALPVTEGSFLSERGKILVIENDEGLLDVLAAFLEQEGYEVAKASNGEAGIAQLSVQSFDLVLTDLAMPDRDGFEVLRYVNEKQLPSPVIIITGKSTIDTTIQARESGAFDYILKPFTPKLIQISVARAFETLRLKQQMERLVQDRTSQLQVTRARLEAFYQMAKVTSSPLPLQEKLDRFCHLSTDLMQAQTGSIMLIDEQGDLLIKAAQGLPPEVVKSSRVKVGPGKVSGWVALCGEPLLINDIEQDPRFRPQEGSKRYTTTSLLSVPLKVEGKVIGVFNVNNKANCQKFSESDKETMVAIAHEVSLAIAHAQAQEALSRELSELALANEKLRRSEEKRRDLTNMIVHDLKGPLGQIIMSLELLQSEPERPVGDRNETLETCLENGQAMLHMIREMLDISRMEEGKVSRKLEPVNLADLVVSCAKRLEAKGSQKGIAVKPRFLGSISPVSVDREQIQRVVYNLLDNAIKFSYEKGAIVIQVELVRNGGGPERRENVMVSVIDSGHGISPEDQQRIFNKFERGEEARSEFGAGLGLAICKEFVEAHGGRIWVTSEKGVGSTFSFTLPVENGRRTSLDV